jgi:hypothetical protein
LECPVGSDLEVDGKFPLITSLLGKHENLFMGWGKIEHRAVLGEARRTRRTECKHQDCDLFGILFEIDLCLGGLDLNQRFEML